MNSAAPSDIVAALENLLEEDYNRIRVRLWRQFGEHLQKIPDAPTPDDLLHEAIKDLLAGRRHCPLERIGLMICLVNIVRSKVNHLYEKWQQEGIVKVSEEILEREPAQRETENTGSELREKILALIEDDPLLVQIVEYRLDHHEEEPIKAQNIASALGIQIKEVYNANRRLKVRLENLVS